ncbi:MAG: sensor histidine kinase KdpD [Thermomicrobiales bacterium]
MNDTTAPRGIKRGTLTILLGAAPGVGKTVAMLQEGHRLRAEGRDVVIGLIETHGRRDTEAQVGDLELIPRKEVEHRGVTIPEMDIPAILDRKPQVILIDELAHTNASGSERTKRYQDVELLLDNGIDVITTVNVQHLESLNDVVESITGVRVRETLPDSILEEASDIRLIDLPPSQLRDRLAKGKIYPPAQAERALQRFFQTGNLTALREMALRRTAEGVEDRLTHYMDEHGIEGIWPATERIVVVLDELAMAGDLLRSAWRLASATRGQLIALVPLDGERPEASSAQLAEDLDATVAPLAAIDVDSIATAARIQRATIVVLRPSASARSAPWKKTLVEELQHKLPGIDVYLPGW